MTEGQELTVRSSTDAALMEKAVIEGDLSNLTPQERVAYYTKVCESMGLNPFTKPFSYIRLNSKLVLYANRDCADQLRQLHKVSVALAPAQIVNEVYIIVASAVTPDGRTDASTGAVAIKGLAGEFLANAMMKAETKAKRRVTLSICGLGWLDETETSSIPGARNVDVNLDTGEIIEPTEAKPEPAAQATPNAQPPDSRLLCPGHKAELVHRQGKRKVDGKPYDGYFCPTQDCKYAIWADALENQRKAAAAGATEIVATPVTLPALDAVDRVLDLAVSKGLVAPAFNAGVAARHGGRNLAGLTPAELLAVENQLRKMASPKPTQAEQNMGELFPE